MVEYKDLTIEQFLAAAASDAPAPGGGSVAALTGALGVALAEMVANLTIGKEKYADVDAEMRKLAADAEVIRKDLIDGMQKDTECFTAYMTALKMPKETEDQKEARREAMQNGLKEASLVPLSIAESAAKIFPLAETAVLKGNKGAVSDGLVAAMLARSAVLCALLNVKINLGSIKDEAFVTEQEAKVRKLEETAVSAEQMILKCSELSRSFLQ